jgi:riboflavin synthase
VFTGLIREIATVKRYHNHILSIHSAYRPKIGDSIAINGVCLTVIRVHHDGFDLELADETRAIIDESKIRGRVHMEPAMRADDRFEGHIVQGHVDSIGRVVSITPRTNGTDFVIEVRSDTIAYIVPKGSITIDGVSLTVNEVWRDRFRLTIIPHTLQETLIGQYKVGSSVHIETDLFARYLDHLLQHRKADPKKSSTSWQEIDQIQMHY